MPMDPVNEFRKKAKGEWEKYQRWKKLQAEKKKEEEELSKQLAALENDEFYLKNFKPNEYEKRKKERTI